jgi:hypothetical protein
VSVHRRGGGEDGWDARFSVVSSGAAEVTTPSSSSAKRGVLGRVRICTTTSSPSRLMERRAGSTRMLGIVGSSAQGSRMGARGWPILRLDEESRVPEEGEAAEAAAGSAERAPALEVGAGAAAGWAAEAGAAGAGAGRAACGA